MDVSALRNKLDEIRDLLDEVETDLVSSLKKKQKSKPNEGEVTTAVSDEKPIPSNLRCFTVAQLRLAKATELFWKYRVNGGESFRTVFSTPVKIIESGYRETLPEEVTTYLEIAETKGWSLKGLKTQLMSEFIKWKEAQLANA